MEQVFMFNTKTIPKPKQKTIDKFWMNVDVKSDDECWNWKGKPINKDTPYGRLRVCSKSIMAHRFSYFLSNGVSPDRLNVLHKCDNPKCVNPRHLFLGTNKDNVADMVKKGRQAHTPSPRNGLKSPHCQGEKNKTAKLTETQVREIIKQYVPRKVSSRMLARKYGVNKSQIMNIVNGTRWQHLSIN